jgi:hypothetical protein
MKTKLSPLAEKILGLVLKYGDQSFANLASELPEFHDGNFAIDLFDNLVIWNGVTIEAADAIRELREADAIYFSAVPLMVYHIDGRALGMPIATKLRRYKTPHWLPIILRAGPGAAPPKSEIREAA